MDMFNDGVVIDGMTLSGNADDNNLSRTENAVSPLLDIF